MKYKIILVMLIIISLFPSLVLGTLIDPIGQFGGVGNRVEVSNILTLSKDKLEGDYTSQILDAGKIVIWDSLEIRYFEFFNSSDVYGAAIFVGEDKDFKDRAVRVNFKSRKSHTMNQDYLAGKFTKLRAEVDGKALPYWIDTTSENLDVWVKMDIPKGEEKKLILLYGDDSITYESDCQEVFILCDLKIYNKIYDPTGDNILASYADLGIWDKKDLGGGVIQTTQRAVDIFYKYGQGEEEGSSSISTTGEGEIDELDFIYWTQDSTDKSDYLTHDISTEDVDDDLSFSFSNGNVFLTDILITNSNDTSGESVTGGIGLENHGITIQVRACEDTDCLGSKFVNVTDDLVALEQSQYLQYKVLFEKKDFNPSISKLIFTYEESTLPNQAAAAILEATVAIDKVKVLGVNITAAQAILDAAIDKQEKLEFTEAISIAGKAEDEADKLYDKYLADQELTDEQKKKQEEQERAEKKIQAEEVMELAQLGIDTADPSNPDTMRAQTMMSQAQLAYNVGDYNLAIERSQDALDILSGREPVQPETPNILGMIIIILVIVIVGAVIYSFVKAKLEE